MALCAIVCPKEAIVKEVLNIFLDVKADTNTETYLKCTNYLDEYMIMCKMCAKIATESYKQDSVSGIMEMCIEDSSKGGRQNV